MVDRVDTEDRVEAAALERERLTAIRL